MRIDEFKKKLGSLGYSIYTSNGEYLITDNYSVFTVAKINMHARDLRLTEHFFQIAESVQSLLGFIILQFARTEPEERIIKKKYYIEVDNDKWNYPYLKYEGEHYELVSIDEATPFTLEEGEKAAAVLGVTVKAVEV